ncbi:uncharacterized protein KY384_005242 [Bacidia gigantensis]|uniref:uncharacterized protein n=1 Tax=Bacidia gigantensis TaxID=2732470 RepID=UPI001D050927|nr:uncharacterized protein KY384_005242 [Bacidia gigantensis]KAG8529761.1 hypothetical protein KY384_005242 [Bacidia gigantensis]
MSRRFYFDDDDSSTSSNDLSSLPYPKPLTRAAFLAPDFDPTSFLSSLQNRHQSLEDLRSELRQRSQDISKELLDLVNSNYEDFLSLGKDLKGGDEKIEEIRVGLLGFKREVEGLRDKVKERRKEVEVLIEERKVIRRRTMLGRGLLEVNRRLEDLERRLMLTKNGDKRQEQEDAASEDESEEEAEAAADIGRLKRHVEQYGYVTRLVNRLGSEHPFLLRQEDRILRLKQTVLLDLGSALKQVMADHDRKGMIPDILELYKIMEAQRDAVAVLQETRSLKR